MAIVIVGLDSIGQELAKSLVEKGESVILIDDHEGRVAQAQAQGFQALRRAIVTPSMAKWSEVQNARAMVAITGSDRTNLRLCQVGRAYFGITTLVAGASDATMAALLEYLGIGAVTTEMSVKQVIEMLRLPA